MFTALLLLTLLLVALTLLPLSPSERWWIRALDFPRLQLACLSLLLLLASLTLRERGAAWSWLPAVLAGACLLYHAWWIYPYTRLARREVQEARPGGASLRVITANVLGGNRNSAGLLRLVRENDPDLLLTLESDRWWEEQLAPLEQDYPYTVKCAQDNLYGMHLYSRLPLSNTELKYLLEPDIPSIHTTIRLPGGQAVAGHFVHPRPPAPNESPDSEARDAELILVGKAVAGNPAPVLVAGDLNDVAWSRTTRLFRKVSGLLDPRVGRGMFNTFHAEHWYLRWPLDHLFHSPHFRLRHLRRLGYFGSDHFPLFSELVYEGEAHGQAPSLDKDADDEALAQRKLEGQPATPDDVPREGEPASE